MMARPVDSATLSAISDFPAAVGPQMTRTSAPAETSFKLVPGDLHDRRATVHVVRGQRGIAERNEQSAHLAERQLLPCLDGCLARDGRGEMLMTLGRGG